MTGETIQFDKATEGASDGKREQSTIVFPYLDLDSAVEVAVAVYHRSGLGSCDLDELAAEMGQTMSGAFRLKTGTAKTFDLTEKDGKSGIKLSELGRQIISPETERAARAEAFMRVPLYAAIYEKYKGHLLPPAKALEREMQSLGVSSKQTDKARQAFERSARQAFYFESGEDRLVRPRAELPTKKTEDGGESKGKGEKPGSDTSGGGSGDGGGNLPPDKDHPLIRGLLMTLPTPNGKWSAEGRASWLRMAASIFDMIYTDADGVIVVTIESSAQKKSAAD